MVEGEYLGAGWGWVGRGQLVATPPLCQSLEILLNIINTISHYNIYNNLPQCYIFII